MHHTPPPDAHTDLPPESLLLRQWLERSGLTARRVASAVSDLGEHLSTEYDFRMPESTLRNMLAGRVSTLAPAWRLAAVGLICNGEPEELDAVGRPDAAEEFRLLRTAYREVLEIHGESASTARLLLSVSKDMPPKERDRLRRKAQDFLRMMSELTPEERDLAMANMESFADLMKRHRMIES
jgi:hypothetical protein